MRHCQQQQKHWRDSKPVATQHSEHAGVDRIPDETIWAISNEFVVFDDAGGERPLFS